MQDENNFRKEGIYVGHYIEVCIFLYCVEQDDPSKAWWQEVFSEKLVILTDDLAYLNGKMCRTHRLGLATCKNITR